MKTITLLSPYVSVSNTQQEQIAYEDWITKKLEDSDSDDTPGIPHEQFMAEIESIIIEAGRRQQLDTSS